MINAISYSDKPYFITMKNNCPKTASCPICDKYYNNHEHNIDKGKRTVSYKIFCMNSVNNYLDYFMARYCLCCGIIFGISHKFKKDTYYSYFIKDQNFSVEQLAKLVDCKKIESITFTCTCDDINCKKDVILTNIEWIWYNDKTLLN